MHHHNVAVARKVKLNQGKWTNETWICRTECVEFTVEFKSRNICWRSRYGYIIHESGKSRSVNDAVCQFRAAITAEASVVTHGPRPSCLTDDILVVSFSCFLIFGFRSCGYFSLSHSIASYQPKFKAARKWLAWKLLRLWSFLAKLMWAAIRREQPRSVFERFNPSTSLRDAAFRTVE